jgi:3-polyprenyl-4-hydroxybenzoate decarboxylase
VAVRDGRVIGVGSLEDVNDLRDWLDVARELGEVRDIAGAHWDQEIGAASEANYKRPSPPALLFDDIAGYPPGRRVLTTDPDSGTLNAGAYRMQVQNDGRAASVNIEAGKHGAAHVRAWFAKAGRAPITASLGHDPLLLVVAGTEVPAGVSELEYAGAVLGRSIEVIRGEATGLPIPARSELAVEGWLYPERKEPEGPFGEWTGYYSGGAAPTAAHQRAHGQCGDGAMDHELVGRVDVLDDRAHQHATGRGDVADGIGSPRCAVGALKLGRGGSLGLDRRVKSRGEVLR